MVSPIVSTLSVAVPVSGIVTVVVAAVAKPPTEETLTFTVMGALGSGETVRVNVAAAPSVTAGPAAMLTPGLVSSLRSATGVSVNAEMPG